MEFPEYMLTTLDGCAPILVDEIDLIAGGISLQRGKLPEHVITLADEWLLRASKFERRALRARSHPVA